MGERVLGDAEAEKLVEALVKQEGIEFKQPGELRAYLAQTPVLPERFFSPTGAKGFKTERLYQTIFPEGLLNCGLADSFYLNFRAVVQESFLDCGRDLVQAIRRIPSLFSEENTMGPKIEEEPLCPGLLKTVRRNQRLIAAMVHLSDISPYALIGRCVRYREDDVPDLLLEVKPLLVIPNSQKDYQRLAGFLRDWQIRAVWYMGMAA